MVEILVGLVSGIVSGMGMGGGSILILLLSLFVGVEQHVAQATNLVFFIPTAFVAIIINAKQKYIDYKTAIPVVIMGVIGAIIGAMVATKMDVVHLKKYFGYFLLSIAVFEIYSLIKKYIFLKNRNNKKEVNINKED